MGFNDCNSAAPVVYSLSKYRVFTYFFVANCSEGWPSISVKSGSFGFLFQMVLENDIIIILFFPQKGLSGFLVRKTETPLDSYYGRLLVRVRGRMSEYHFNGSSI
jgi:hypothetical protein